MMKPSIHPNWLRRDRWTKNGQQNAYNRRRLRMHVWLRIYWANNEWGTDIGFFPSWFPESRRKNEIDRRLRLLTVWDSLPDFDRESVRLINDELNQRQLDKIS